MPRVHVQLFPYPLRATYTGSGCGGEAGTFVPVMPAAPTHDNDDWAGKEMFAGSPRKGPDTIGIRFSVGTAPARPAARREEEFSMPMGEVPERYRDILASTALGHLATIGPDGRPQVNPIWFLSDGRSVSLSVKPETVKYRNLRANPFIAMSVVDLACPDRYVEIRGEVIEFELYETLAWVNQLARKYTGADFTRGTDGEPRYKVVIRIDAWTGQG